MPASTGEPMPQSDFPMNLELILVENLNGRWVEGSQWGPKDREDLLRLFNWLHSCFLDGREYKIKLRVWKESPRFPDGRLIGTISDVFDYHHRLDDRHAREKRATIYD